MQSRGTTRAFARSMTEISDFHRFTMCIGYLAVQHISCVIAYYVTLRFTYRYGIWTSRSVVSLYAADCLLIAPMRYLI